MSENRIPVGDIKNISSLSNRYSILPVNDDPWEFTKNAYHGTGGFYSGDYLVPHDKETNLSRRTLNIYYKNYVKGIIDSLIVPTFSEDAYRVTNNPIFESFLDNVDSRGNDMQEFTKTVLKYTRLHGVCFTIMNSFTQDELPDTLNEVIGQRKYPFISFRTADEVESYTTDDFDRLTSISFDDGCIVENGKEIEIYRLWTDEYSVRYIEKDDGIVEIGERLYHNLGFLPVIATYLDMDSDVIPHPPVYDIARMNYGVFNKDSEQRSLERLCGFPTLTIQSKDTDINMNIGADSLIVYGGEYDGGVTAPSWIAPPSNSLTDLNNLSNELLAKLIEAANVLGATAVNSGASVKSGVAMSYEFLGQSFALKTTAKIAENFETMVSIMFGLFISQPIEYEVKYETNYRPSQDEVDKKVGLLERLIDMNISGPVTATLQQELVREVVNYYKINVDTDQLIQSIATDANLI